METGGDQAAHRAARIAAEPPMQGADWARVVSPREVSRHGGEDGPLVAAIDTGIKGSIVRELVARGARVDLHPADTSAADLNSVLREIAAALRTAHANYSEAEAANTAMWG